MTEIFLRLIESGNSLLVIRGSPDLSMEKNTEFGQDVKWKDGRREDWKDGRIEGWKDRRMEGWKAARGAWLIEANTVLGRRKRLCVFSAATGFRLYAKSIPRTPKVLLRFSFLFLGSVPRRG
jgi:hypothetical protein